MGREAVLPLLSASEISCMNYTLCIQCYRYRLRNQNIGASGRSAEFEEDMLEAAQQSLGKVEVGSSAETPSRWKYSEI